MSPDKIYINVHPLGVDYSIVPIPDFGGVEYIRKDALLEWAKEQKTLMELGGHISIDDVIDKINSM